MKSTDNTIQGKYFQEASILLAHEGFDTHAGDGELLQVSFHGNPLCEITKNGGTRYRHEDVSTDVMSDALEKATSVAATAAEYMKLMENAPPLKASSLDAPYKLLADFNGYVLGGMESGHGVQLTTWQWTYDKDGLTLGHYFGNDYAAAKHNFALRSGLVQEQEQFTPEQLIEIYRCCADTMTSDIPLTCDQEERIDEIQTQITEMVPDYAERMKAAMEQDASQQQMM